MRTAAHWLVRAADRALDLALFLLCGFLLFVSGYSLLDNLWQMRAAQDASLLAFKPSLEEPADHSRWISDAQVGWLTIFDTAVDYPVMQGADNFEYLNKDPYGDFKLSGSLFLDCRSGADFRDAYSVIYGHHMEHGAMFGALDAYLEKPYFNTHRKGRLVTADAVYEFAIFAVTYAGAGDKLFFSSDGTEREAILTHLREEALWYEEPEPDRPVVALATCYGEDAMTRLLVLGTLQRR